MYTLDGSGTVVVVATVAAGTPLVRAAAMSVRPNSIVANPTSLYVDSSTFGLAVFDERSGNVYAVGSSGVVTPLTSESAGYTNFALGPDGTVCFAGGGSTPAYTTSIQCDQPSGRMVTDTAVGPVDNVKFGANGNLYYSSGGNAYLWSATGSTALIPPSPTHSPPVSGTLTLTGTVVATSVLYQARYTRDQPAGLIIGELGLPGGEELRFYRSRHIVHG